MQLTKKEICFSSSYTDVYQSYVVRGVDVLNAREGFIELPLGEDDVDWDNYPLVHDVKNARGDFWKMQEVKLILIFIVKNRKVYF